MSNGMVPLVVAHRGASADHPENTREAFIGAARQDADLVELDVRHTIDGELIVHHDPWYRDKRLVWSTRSHERPASVVDLAVALDACLEGAAARGRPLGVNVEIKNMVGDMGGDDVPHSLDVADEVVELLTRRAAGGIVEEILISSFDPRTIDRVRELGGPPTAQLVLDVNTWPDVIASTAERGHGFIHPWDPFVDERFIEASHSAGLAVNTWTVDDLDRIVALAAMGVDGVVTNVPGAARSVLA